MSEATSVGQKEEDLAAMALKQSEEKSSISTDSAISTSSSTITGVDSSTTSSIDGDTDKACAAASDIAQAAESHEGASHPQPFTFRQSRYHYQHHRAHSYLRYEQQQQMNLTAGAPFGTLYAPPPPPPPAPGAPLAALHKPSLAYAPQTLFYKPLDAISMGHHLVPQHPTNYCETIDPTQPATAVYTAAAIQANATGVPMALPGQPVNLNLLDQGLLMTQFGRPPPQPPEPHAIYYYTAPAHLNLASAAANQQQQQKSFTTNYGRRPSVGVELETAPVPSSFGHHQQQAMQMATSTCCCHQEQQQHELAAVPIQAAAPQKLGSFIDEGGARQSSDVCRDSRDAANAGGGKTSPATSTRGGDLDDNHRRGQNLTQDLTSPPPEQQQPPSPAGCLGKSAPPSAPHSPPPITVAGSRSSSSSSPSSYNQPAVHSRAAYMGHSQPQQPRNQQEATRPYYRQPSGPTYYHHLLPTRPVSHTHHHQQQNQHYYNSTAPQQQQYNNLTQQQYLVAGRQYMPSHLYGLQSHPQHHQLHLPTNYPNTQQQQQLQQQLHRQLILLPSQASVNYPHLNYQQLAGAHHQQLYGHHQATTNAPHYYHATSCMHPTAPYHHQYQAYACHPDVMRSQPPYLVPANYHQLPTSWPPPRSAHQLAHYAQQQQSAPNHLMPNPTAELVQTLSSKYKPDANTLLLFKQAQTWAAMLPIDYEPTKTRQAYGMDKVWRDEFEQLFSQLSSDVGWTLVEVETNPSLRNSASIIGYRGRYLIQLELEEQNQLAVLREDGEGSLSNETIDSVSDKGSESDNESTGSKDDLSCQAGDKFSEAELHDPELETEARVAGENEEREQETESDCDSGAQVNSTSGCSSSSPLQSLVVTPSVTNLPSVRANSREHEKQQLVSCSSLSLAPPPSAPIPAKKLLSTRFRMFIDSAKVRFCCDHCGHGWTSMKGRVVFWYELFELLPELKSSVSDGVEDEGREESLVNHNVEEDVDDDESHLVGYCAYKLFGQQCDVCKIEGRFERPMWYPEEVTKVLNNLYNKIGQVYFGFKMPTIDKQRRAGKPKTSHNSSLCQACYDGVCTDRK